jgi:hypothetical protein
MSPREQNRASSAAVFSHPSPEENNRMAVTACLIALALGGLILIMLWEMFT